jgi:hypothetical protein
MIDGHIQLPDNINLQSLDWKDYFQCYQQTEETKKYYNQYNSSIWQMFDCCPDWTYDIAKLLPQVFKNYVASITKIDPGQTVPWHQDKHYVLQEKFGSGDTSRFLVFLEDWKTGHYFEIHNQPIVKWKRGDYLHFQRKDWHLSGNMGLEPFFSAQVTVLNLDKSL